MSVWVIKAMKYEKLRNVVLLQHSSNCAFASLPACQKQNCFIFIGIYQLRAWPARSSQIYMFLSLICITNLNNFVFYIHNFSLLNINVFLLQILSIDLQNIQDLEMGPKKQKPQVVIQKQVKQVKQVVKGVITSGSKWRVIKTIDQLQFLVADPLLSKFSPFIRRQLTNLSPQQPILLQYSSLTFQPIYDFIQLHKQCPLQNIILPMRSTVNLKLIMELQDVGLMDKVFQDGGWDAIKALIDAVTGLEIQDFRKRLFCFVASKIANFTLDQLKIIYQIPNSLQMNQDLIKQETRTHLENLKKSYSPKIDQE